jgi:sulfite reductase beta subunit-like hemoprotein
VAGGLGSTPEVAHLWQDFVPEADLLAVCEALISVFFRDGERKNRKKARLKFLLRKVGEAELFKRFDEELARIKAERGPVLAASLSRSLAAFTEGAAPPPEAGGVALGDAAFARWRRTNTLAQKQVGYRAVTVKLALGDISSAQMRALAALSQRFGNGELRTTNTQNFVLRWVPEGRLVRLHRELGLIGLAEPDAGHITDVVACPGADYCSLAITKSMGVAEQIRAHLVPEGGRAEAEDLVRDIGEFEIKISGCPNSCGQHHVADLGMTGLLVKDKEGNEKPYYSLRVGGGVGPNARIGERLDGRVPEGDTPRVIAAIGRHYLAGRGEGESFKDFVARVGAQEIGRAGFEGVDSVI